MLCLRCVYIYIFDIYTQIDNFMSGFKILQDVDVKYLCLTNKQHDRKFKVGVKI